MSNSVYQFLTLVLIATLPLAAVATESCGEKAAHLLLEKQIEPLSAMFTDQPNLQPALKEMIEKVGALSDVQEVSGPRFKQHRRMAVGRASGDYLGYWINAKSEKLGAVQFHVAQLPGSACTVLAIQLDVGL